MPSSGYSSSQDLDNDEQQVQRYKFEMRYAEKNSPPKKVIPVSKAGPNSNKKKQQNVRLNGRFNIDTNPTNSIISKELRPESTKQAEGAIKALNNALNQSSLTFLQQKRSISRNANQTNIPPATTNYIQPNSQDTTDPLIGTKIPQVTYLAETSSLGSGSRIIAAPATSTKQPALILQPTGNAIPPPATAPLASKQKFNQNTTKCVNQVNKMNMTTTTMFERSKQLKAEQIKPQTRKSQQSFIQSKFPFQNNQSAVQQATQETQKLLISESDQKIVQGLQPGEHYIKLVPNDYWEFYKQHLQSFKKHDHGIKAPKRSLLAPANRTAIPLDLAKVQNTAFKKMMPKNDSDATLQFQKEFLWNQQAEDRAKQRDQQKLREIAFINQSDPSIKKQSQLDSSKQSSISANESSPQKPFKTSKFPITQNSKLHPEVLVSADKVTYLRFQDQIGLYGDPKRIIGSPGKASRGLAQTLANWNLGQRLETSYNPERQRTAVTSQKKKQKQSRANSPLSRENRMLRRDTKQDRTRSTGFGQVNAFDQERQYMKDWMLGRMYTRIQWVMKEADQRCKCCNRIHCLNKKKSRDGIYQGIRNVSQHIVKDHSLLLSPKSDEKIKNKPNPRDIVSATSVSYSKEIPFTPVSIQNAMIKAQGYQQQRNFVKNDGQKGLPHSLEQCKLEQSEKKSNKISTQSLNSRMIQVTQQQIAAFGSDMQQANDRGTPSIFSPNKVTPGLFEIQQNHQNQLDTAEQKSQAREGDRKKQESTLEYTNQYNQNNMSLKSMEYDLLNIQPKLLSEQEEQYQSNNTKLDNISSITPISEQPLLLPTGDFQVVGDNIGSGLGYKRKLDSRGKNDLFGLKDNLVSSVLRNTYYDKTVSLPWVSPYIAHQIKKEQKLTKVAARVTKNMENQRTLPQKMTHNRANKLQYLLKNHQLLGEGVSLFPSAFMTNKDLQNDPQEYRQKSTQGTRAHLAQQTILPQLVTVDKKGSAQRNQFFERNILSADNIVSQRTHPQQNQYLNATIKQIMEQQKFDKGGASPKKGATQPPTNRVVRWQDQIEEGQAQVRVGTANKLSAESQAGREGKAGMKTKNFAMDAIQQEERKTKKIQGRKAKGTLPIATRYAEKLQSSGIYSNNSAGSSALRVFDMNKSLIQDRSLLKEQIKIAIRRPSPDNLFKIKASKTAVGFFKGQGTRKIIGGAIPRKPPNKDQEQKNQKTTFADAEKQSL